jgi:hypothetical protein
MAKYIARYNTNNKSTLGSCEGNNLQKVIKEIKERAKAETFAGNKAYWDVILAEDPTTPIKAGVINN